MRIGRRLKTYRELERGEWLREIYTASMSTDQNTRPRMKWVQEALKLFLFQRLPLCHRPESCENGVEFHASLESMLQGGVLVGRTNVDK
jgi:hypothetical protein